VPGHTRRRALNGDTDGRNDLGDSAYSAGLRLRGDDLSTMEMTHHIVRSCLQKPS
jgi:hypothetical protein